MGGVMSESALKNRKERLTCFDLIRVFSCICVLLVHFNATVSGYNAGVFIYPNSIFTNYLFGGRYYVGDIGVSLFFMLSGASLMYTWRQERITKFYIRRFRSIYPMFWIAWFVATAVDFLSYKGLNSGDILYMLFSVLGLDGYLCSQGLIPFDFYKLGEWFLGCIIILYLIYPLIRKAVDTFPLPVMIIAIGLYTACVRMTSEIGSWHFFLRIPEMMMGILFVKYRVWERRRLLLGIGIVSPVAGCVCRDFIHPLTLCISLCIGLFAWMALLARVVRSAVVKQYLKKLADLTYPAFLVHHWLIQKMYIGFPEGILPRRSVWMLFVVYLGLTVVLSEMLSVGAGKMLHYFDGLRRSSKTKV